MSGANTTAAATTATAWWTWTGFVHFDSPAGDLGSIYVLDGFLCVFRIGHLNERKTS